MTEFTERMKRLAEKLDEVRQICGEGRIERHLGKLIEHSEALLTQFAPLKVDDKAEVVSDIECKDGWSGSEKDLAIGAVGDVLSVDWRGGKFWFEFCPDKQWYRYQDEWHPKERKHTYSLPETVLSKVIE